MNFVLMYFLLSRHLICVSVCYRDGQTTRRLACIGVVILYIEIVAVIKKIVKIKINYISIYRLIPTIPFLVFFLFTIPPLFYNMFVSDI